MIRRKHPIVIVPYDPSWPELFARERMMLLQVLAPLTIGIEHIGSTAVPHLAAKPIIDIMIGLERLEAVETRFEILAALGYTYVPEFERLLPDRRYFRKSRRGWDTHHLHVVKTKSEFWDRHLGFRDCLRTHPHVAKSYEVLKRHLATIYPFDGMAYAEAKTGFIEGVLSSTLEKNSANSTYLSPRRGRGSSGESGLA